LLGTALAFSAGYATVGLVVILLVVLVEGIVTRRLPWRRTSGDIYLASFLVAFLISGWASSYRPFAIGSAGVAAVTLFVGLGPLYRQLLQNPARLAPFVSAWVTGGLAATLWAGYLSLRTGDNASTPALGQNALGTTLLVALVLSLGLLLTSLPAWRYLVAGGCALLTLGIALTASRGAWLGTVVGVLTFLWLAKVHRGWLVAVLLVLLGMIGFVLINPERSYLVSRARGIGVPVQNQARIAVAKSAGAIFADHPILGTGLNTFSFVHPQYKFPNDPDSTQPFAPNVFLNMAAEGGLLGLIAFAAILVWAGREGWRWCQAGGSRSESIMSAAILAAFLGLLTHQFLDGTMLSVHVGSGLWFLVAMLAASSPHSGTMGARADA